MYIVASIVRGSVANPVISREKVYASTTDPFNTNHFGFQTLIGKIYRRNGKVTVGEIFGFNAHAPGFGFKINEVMEQGATH